MTNNKKLSTPLIITLVLVSLAIFLIALLFFNRSNPISSCLIPLIGQVNGKQHNPFIYEIDAKDTSSIVEPEAVKLKSDKRRVAMKAFYTDNKIILGMICNGCEVAEESFGYKKSTPTQWCKLNLTTKSESGDDFYKKVDEIKTSTIAIDPAKMAANIDWSDAITFTGMIKKEKIPTEMQLPGEFWYWMYFDKPFINRYSMAGEPVNESKLQILKPVDPNVNIESFLNKHVKVVGKIGYGISESNVIETKSIELIK